MMVSGGKLGVGIIIIIIIIKRQRNRSGPWSIENLPCLAPLEKKVGL